MELATALGEAWHRVDAHGFEVGAHPWAFADAPLTPFDQDSLTTVVTTWARTVARLDEVLTRERPLLGTLETALDDVSAVARELEGLPPMGAADPEWLPKLSDEVVREAVRRWLEDARQLEASRKCLVGLCGAPDAARDLADEIASAIRDIRDAPRIAQELVIRDLSVEVDRAESAVADLDAATRLGERFAAIVRAEEPPTFGSWRLAHKAITRLRETLRELLLMRTPALVDEQNTTRLREAEMEARRLREEQTALSASLTGCLDQPPQELRAHAHTLANAGWYSFVFGDYRRAKGVYRTLTQGAKAPPLAMAKALTQVADYLEARERLSADEKLREICGDSWREMDTDFGALVAVNKWGAEVSSALRGAGRDTSRLRKLLLVGDLDDLDDLAALGDDGAFEVFARLTKDRGMDDGVRPADEMAQRRRALTVLSRCRDLATRIGLRPELSLSAFALVGESITQMGAHADAMAANEAALRVVGQRDQGVDVAAATIELSTRLDALPVADVGREQLYSRYESTRAKVMQVGAELARLADEEKAQRAALRDVGHGTAGPLGHEPDQIAVHVACRRLAALTNKTSLLPEWAAYRTARGRALAGLPKPVVVALEAEGQPLGHLRAVFEHVFYRTLCEAAFSERPSLRDATGAKQAHLRERFVALDREIIELSRRALAAELCRRPHDVGREAARKSEWTGAALIRHECSKKMRHVAIRSLLDRAGGRSKILRPVS